MVLLVPMLAQAERLGVVVRQGARDETIVQRLRGQVADLNDVTLEIEASEVEPALDGQLATAERLSSEHNARVVVWFVTRGKKLEVAVATPQDHRLFVREIPAAGESSMAEAAAIAVRSAVRSIALGGTIGIEVKPHAPEPVVEEHVDMPPPPPRPRSTTTNIEVAVGWQVAIDGGADGGAQALVQRTTLARDAWGVSLALSLGLPLAWNAANDVALDVSRSGALVGGELRFGSYSVGVGAGALLYHRSTSTAPSGLTPTPSNSTVAFAGAVEGAWHARLTDSIGLVASIGLDAVAGAPEAAVSRGAMIDTVDTIRPLQPRASIAMEVTSW